MSPQVCRAASTTLSVIHRFTFSRAALPEVGQRFIAVAAAALRPGGSMWLVANRHLPYEAVLKERFGLVKTAAEGNGYKVIEAVKTVRKRT